MPGVDCKVQGACGGSELLPLPSLQKLLPVEKKIYQPIPMKSSEINKLWNGRVLEATATVFLFLFFFKKT